MSRIGKQTITLPEGVSALVEEGRVTVKGPKGEMSYVAHPAIEVRIEDNVISCVPADLTQGNALWGTTRAQIANLVTGVSEGFTKKLELQGVGYRASLKGKDLELMVGYSHPVTIQAPEGIVFTVEKEIITVEGIDRQQVGQMAAEIRKVRKPEPYKGKGIRYVGEQVRRKVGKVVGAVEG